MFRSDPTSTDIFGRSTGDNADQAVSMGYFEKTNTGRSLQDLQGELGTAPFTEPTSGGFGPRNRYLTDPANPADVIDLRHFLVVGPRRPGFGTAIELVQLIGDPRSAFHPQDLFSNRLGHEFFGSSFLDPSRPNEIASQIGAFLRSRERE
jgi:hypothetical protein